MCKIIPINIKEDTIIMKMVKERQARDNGHRYTHEEVKLMLKERIKNAKKNRYINNTRRRNYNE